MKSLYKYNGLRRNNRLLIWNNFYYTSSEKHNFVKLFEASFDSYLVYWISVSLYCIAFDFIPLQTFEIHIQGIFLHK